jgi:hypothetical protein
VNLDDALKVGRSERVAEPLLREAVGVMVGALDRLDSLIRHWGNLTWLDREQVITTLRPPE